MATIGLAYGTLTATDLLQVWNPTLAFPFFALFVLQAWLVARGEWRRLLGLAFVATFLVQTHVGYVPLVGLIALWAVVRLALASRRAGVRLWSARVLGPPAAVLAVTWCLPLVVDPLVVSPSNLSRLVRFTFGSPPGKLPAVGLRGGLGYLAAEFHPVPPWLGGADPTSYFTALTPERSAAWLIVPVALVAATYALARRRGRGDLAVLSELLGLELVAGVAAISLVDGPPYPYVFYWRAIIGSSVVVLSLMACAQLVRPPRRRAAVATLAAVLVAALVASSARLTADVARSNGPVSPIAPAAAAVLRQLAASGQPAGPVLVRNAGSTLQGLWSALVDQLVRERRPVYVPSDAGYIFGRGRVRSPEQVRELWYVVEDSQELSLLEPDARREGAGRRPGARPGRPRAAHHLAGRAVADRLRAAGRSDLISSLGFPYLNVTIPASLGVPAAEIDELDRLNKVVVAHHCLCSVVAFASDRAPSLPP